MTFGEHLRELRENKGYTQEEIAGLLHVVRSTYTKYETNNSLPDLEKLQLLADILEVDYNTILNY